MLKFIEEHFKAIELNKWKNKIDYILFYI
jgi:hypothetical protein